MAETEIRADRTLLLPGPYPPLCHLGATLLRYVTHSALRYALYQVGEVPPEGSVTRFVSLRLYLDAVALRQALSSRASEEILGALLDPGGVAAGTLPWRLRGTLWFHRLRLRIPRPRRRTREPSPGSRPAEVVSSMLPALGDALLSDLIAALDRRQTRARSRKVEPIESREASRFLRSKEADLARLGLPDPISASWVEQVPRAVLDAPTDQLAGLATHPLRGRFREEYRNALDLLRPCLLALAQRARDRGYLASNEDLFFVPFELIEDLDGDHRPSWLTAAVESNRGEWLEVSERKAPADTLGNVEIADSPDLPPQCAPLWPLP